MLLSLIALFGVVATSLTCLLTRARNPLVWVAALVGYLLLGLVLAVGFLYLMAKRVDRSVPQEQDSPFYRRLTDVYIRAIVALGRIRVETRGLENLPKEGRFMLVCNHLSIADPAVLLYAFPDSQLAFISKKENDHMPIVGQIMHKLQCQLLDRENDRAALRTILNCVKLLKEDRASLGVFPEGYTSPDGLLRRFRSGVFKIAQKTGVPVVVCTVRNTRTVVSNILKLKSSRVQLHLVGVVEDTAGRPTAELAEQVYRMMADDLGPALVHQGE